MALKTEGDENVLANAGTAALDQNAQYDYQQHAGNESAKQKTTHLESPFPAMDGFDANAVPNLHPKKPLDFIGFS